VIQTKQTIHFKAKVFKIGGSWGVIIPSAFIKHGIIEPTKKPELMITIEED
jgi:antitoxin component of MazEF toxin-antitoxin module